MKKVVASHLVRSSNNLKHGGLFVVDVTSGKYEKVFDWEEYISLEGRAGDRGLRGISVYKDRVYVASARYILVFDKNFKLIEKLSNEYFHANHETIVHKDKLYIVSTGADSLLVYDLINKKFECGILLRSKVPRVFDPNKSEQINCKDTKHYNSVYEFQGNIYISGTGVKNLFRVEPGKPYVSFSKIPPGTHNCYIVDNDTLIMNDTRSNRIILQKRNSSVIRSVPVTKVKCNSVVNEKVARQPFPRGLVFDKEFVVGGSSPGMISVYNYKDFKKIRDVIMSDDIRMSIHGIAVIE